VIMSSEIATKMPSVIAIISELKSLNHCNKCYWLTTHRTLKTHP